MVKTISANDAGLSEKFIQQGRSVLRGTRGFNVKIKERYFWDKSVYHFLQNISWFRFTLITFATFLIINAAYGFLFVLCGEKGIGGLQAGSWLHEYAECFFFSVHTFTTVGYGNMIPVSRMVNLLVVADVFTGIMYIALATGVLFGRFSRPRAQMRFSSNFIIAPYKDGRAMMIRFTNVRANRLMDAEATLYIVIKNYVPGVTPGRRFLNVDLEIKTIPFFTLPWTVVHPIDTNSPLWGKTKEEIEKMELELLFRVKAFDETYNQNVYQTYNYTSQDLVYGAKFNPAFGINEEGVTEVYLSKIGDYIPVELKPIDVEAAVATAE